MAIGRMRKRGISEEVVHLFNPMPDVTEAEILKEAGLENMPAKEGPVFELSWQWSAGLERERIHLKPGQYHPLRDSEAQDAMKELGEKGIATVRNTADHAEVRKAAIDGLSRAIRFYHDRGTPLIRRFRRERGVTTEEMEEMKYDYWPYHRNAAIAKILTREREDWKRAAGSGKDAA